MYYLISFHLVVYVRFGAKIWFAVKSFANKY